MFAERFDLSRIAQLLDPFLAHNRRRAFPAREHLRENFLGLLPADLSALDQIHQFIECRGRDRAISDRAARAGQSALQIVQDPIRDALRFPRAFRGRLKKCSERQVVRQHSRVVDTHAILLDESRPLRARQLGQSRAHLLEQRFSLHRHEIGLGEVTVIVRRLFRAHQKRLARAIIPAARLLLQFFAACERLCLPLHFVSEGAPDRADRVHVLDLDLRAEFLLGRGPDRDIAVATQLAFLHVRVADRAVNQDLFERREKGERFLGRIDFGLAHDLHQRRARAVEIDRGVIFEMKTFRDIFLQVNADERHFFLRRRNLLLRVLWISEVVQRHAAVRAQRQIVLGNLIVLRHVRIEITFAIELAERRDVAPEHQSGQDREPERFVVHHWQRAGQPEASRTSVRVRRRSEFHPATAEHFRARLELDVHFETNGSEHCRFQISDFRLEAADLRDATMIATSSLASARSGSMRFGGRRLDSAINSSQSKASSASSKTTPILAMNSAFERARHVAR